MPQSSPVLATFEAGRVDNEHLQLDRVLRRRVNDTDSVLVVFAPDAIYVRDNVTTVQVARRGVTWARAPHKHPWATVCFERQSGVYAIPDREANESRGGGGGGRIVCHIGLVRLLYASDRCSTDRTLHSARRQCEWQAGDAQNVLAGHEFAHLMRLNSEKLMGTLPFTKSRVSPLQKLIYTRQQRCFQKNFCRSRSKENGAFTHHDWRGTLERASPLSFSAYSVSWLARRPSIRP